MSTVVGWGMIGDGMGEWIGMSDVIVVGSGLIGMLTARELALGGLSVRLVERGVVGRESSWAGGGILSPLYPWRYPEAVTRLALWGQERYQELCEQLAVETGIDPEWTLSGMLAIAVSGEERDEAVSWAVRFGHDVDSLDGQPLHQCEPALSHQFNHGLWLPQVAQLRNPRLLKALRISLEDLGVDIVEQSQVNALAVTDGELLGVQTEHGLLRAGRVVVAAGAWSGELLAAIGPALPIEPVRGQMLLFKAPTDLLLRVVLHDGHYLIPRRDGRILAGSTLERVGFHKEITTEGLDALRQSACALVPALAEIEVEHHWAGLRPGSPDGVPTIAEHPTVAGLYVNSGHYRNGVVLGLPSSRLMADIVLGHAPILEPVHYRWPEK